MFIIFIGVSGSGKTTIGQMTADALGISFFEGDDYHPQENVEKMSQGIPLTDEDRDKWLERLSDLIQSRLDQGKSGVLSCSALKKKYRDRLRVDQDQVHFIYLKGSYELIYDRMEDREDHFMSEELLKSQFNTLEAPGEVFTVEIDQSPENILEAVLIHLNTMGFPTTK